MNNIDADEPAPKRQVKSKERVTAHGEVFTAEREVNAMLDLVKDETERLESRFLEPACGDGNFLIEILRRKLNRVRKGSVTETECDIARAVSSIYGVELLPDNTEACRQRLFNAITGFYKERCKDCPVDSDFIKSIRYLLQRNIICGDALNYCTTDGDPIIFSEWTFCDTMVSRCDFQFNFLVKKTHQYSLFDEQGEVQQFDEPVKSFPQVHYSKIFSYGE